MDIIKNFTRRNLSRNRKRTIVTIIGVMLSAALLCTVVGMAATFRRSIVEDYKENSGDWHVCFGIRNKEQYDVIMNNAHVEKGGVAESLWFVKRDGVGNYLNIYGMNDEIFTQMNFKLSEGRLPENQHEMVITQAYAFSKDAPKVGDGVTFQVGDRVIRTDDGIEIPYYGWSFAEEEVFLPVREETYKIVGILDNYNSNFSALCGFVRESEMQGKYTNLYIRYDQPSKYSKILEGMEAALKQVKGASGIDPWSRSSGWRRWSA